MSDNRAKMAAAILTSILEANADESGMIYVDPDHAKESLVMAMAALIEADPEVRTPEDVRRAAETISLQLMDKIASMRASYERTGKRLWSAEIVRPN